MKLHFIFRKITPIYLLFGLMSVVSCTHQKNERSTQATMSKGNNLKGSWRIETINPRNSSDTTVQGLFALGATQQPLLETIHFTDDNEVQLLGTDKKVLVSGTYDIKDENKLKVLINGEEEDYQISETGNDKITLVGSDAQSMDVVLVRAK